MYLAHYRYLAHLNERKAAWWRKKKELARHQWHIPAILAT
jgi:hypothetical protein